MNAAVNNGQDEPPPLEVAIRGLVQQYGVLRVLFGALRQVRAVPPRPAALPMNAHLRRDIGLPPDG